MKPRKRKLYIAAYNSSEVIGDYYETPDWKLALEFYQLIKKNTQKLSYDDLKNAEKKGDFISLDVNEDDEDGEMTNYRTIYRKEVKA